MTVTFDLRLHDRRATDDAADHATLTTMTLDLRLARCRRLFFRRRRRRLVLSSLIGSSPMSKLLSYTFVLYLCLVVVVVVVVVVDSFAFTRLVFVVVIVRSLSSSLQACP